MWNTRMTTGEFILSHYVHNSGRTRFLFFRVSSKNWETNRYLFIRSIESHDHMLSESLCELWVVSELWVTCVWVVCDLYDTCFVHPMIWTFALSLTIPTSLHSIMQRSNSNTMPPLWHSWPFGFGQKNSHSPPSFQSSDVAFVIWIIHTNNIS